VEAVEAVQYIAGLFEAFIGFLATIGNLGVNADVVVTAVTEKDVNSNVMFRC